MLTRIETLNYRALRYIRQSLLPVQVLIGPNASGKSTFLDIPYFVADILNQRDLTDAVRDRAPDFRDLTWMRSSDWLEFAIEAEIPKDLADRSERYDRLRYEIRLGVNDDGELGILVENLWFAISSTQTTSPVPRPFPALRDVPDRITREPNSRTPKGWRKVVSKTNTGNDYFKSETTDWNNLFRLGPKRPALANLPEDESRFPVSTWFKRYISDGIQRIVLNSEAIRRPSPPQSPRTFLPDGSNLPWVIHELEEKHPAKLTEWVELVKTALPTVRHITTIERPEDRHRYLVVEYDSGLQAPSWIVSDGTLRMLALTILAYLPNLDGVYLVEEPENGIHPRAVETVFQSLTTVYEAQVFLATHSPVMLSMADPAQLLCFSRTEAGETDIIQGAEHPGLEHWQGEVSLSTLFAAGVLE